MIKYLLLFMVISCSAMAYAPCGYIGNDDLRNYCYALSSDDEHYCQYIHKDNLRYMCEAEVTKNNQPCEYISDNDQKYLCKARAE